MTLKTLVAPFEVELVERKSRFIGLGFPCIDRKSFQDDFLSLQKSYRDARHIAYAFRIWQQGQIYSKAFDAGEPSQTAGQPILRQLEGHGGIQVAVFVVRYFGGIKLGRGGLARAYGQAARLVMTEGVWVDYMPTRVIKVAVPYHHESRFLKGLLAFQGTLDDRCYQEGLVNFVIQVPEKSLLDFEKWLEPLKAELP